MELERKESLKERLVRLGAASLVFAVLAVPLIYMHDIWDLPDNVLGQAVGLAGLLVVLGGYIGFGYFSRTAWSIRSRMSLRSRIQDGSQKRTIAGQPMMERSSVGAASRSATVGREPQLGLSSITATCQRVEPGDRTAMSTVKSESPCATRTS